MSSATLLRPDSWLADQPENFKAALAGIGVERRLLKGAPLYHADDSGGIFGIRSGCIEITVAFTCSPHSSLHFAYPGYFIGQRPFTLGIGYAVTTAARLDSVVLEFRLADLRKLVAKNPDWWKCLAHLTGYWFDAATCSAVDLLPRKPENRCIAVLLRLGGYRPFEQISSKPRAVPVTQAELAANANLSRSSVNEILGQLAESGLIRRGYGGIEVLQPAALSRKIELEGD